MIAVVPVRGGELPGGGEECVAEAGGRALLIGDGAAAAAGELHGIATDLRLAEAPRFAPGAWAAALAPHLAGERQVLLPASPDGRDLAPRLAARLGWPLVAGVVEIDGGRLHVAASGGRALDVVAVDGSFVATLQPGRRGVARDRRAAPRLTTLALVPPPPAPARPAGGGPAGGGPAGGGREDVPVDAELVEVTPADPATMDLADASRVVGAGAGLGSAEACELLIRVGLALGAAAGGTRVVTDWGWLPVDRQIGTTGVAVAPELYLAFGVSGAVQHVAGLGEPAHVVSVNVDPACPMSSMADLAVVADAPATLEALARRLGVEAPGTGSAPPGVAGGGETAPGVAGGGEGTPGVGGGGVEVAG